MNQLLLWAAVISSVGFLVVLYRLYIVTLKMNGMWNTQVAIMGELEAQVQKHVILTANTEAFFTTFITGGEYLHERISKLEDIEGIEHAEKSIKGTV
jgi:hypothetical protein